MSWLSGRFDVRAVSVLWLIAVPRAHGQWKYVNNHSVRVKWHRELILAGREVEVAWSGCIDMKVLAIKGDTSVQNVHPTVLMRAGRRGTTLKERGGYAEAIGRMVQVANYSSGEAPEVVDVPMLERR
ncbi:hypothetical protein [Neorhodopirellula lusitana]|uniref:hypothetical protein n=1 Tax=Neorhodopirellula lusitana TaxID=445327 RepID=UPI00385016EC